jgi:hypothetical protein
MGARNSMNICILSRMVIEKTPRLTLPRFLRLLVKFDGYLNSRTSIPRLLVATQKESTTSYDIWKNFEKEMRKCLSQTSPSGNIKFNYYKRREGAALFQYFYSDAW